MVLIALAILFPFTASFNYKARVDWQAAVNHGDEVRARAVQRGAMQLSVLMFELQRMVFNQKQFRDMMGAMDITMLAPYLMSIFGTEDGAEGLGALVGVDTTALNELALDGGGSFEVRLEAESGKLNVNCLAIEKDGENTPRARVTETLEALMLPKLYDPLFDEEKSDGERYNRQHVLQAIVDYIDDDTKRFDAYRLRQSSQDERYGYTELHDPYQSRDSRLDSILELHLVEAVDDDWMAAFGSELTVYGGCKVNLNFASPEQIAQVLRHAVSGADRWKTEGDNFLLMTMPLSNFVIESREFNLFQKLEDFKDLVAKPDQFVNPLTLLGDESDNDYAANLPKVPDGMEVRVNGGSRNGQTWGGLKDVATVEPERIYRIEVITTVGSVRKRLTAVYDIQYARSQSAGKGAWLYYRED
ncbi:type II secretion system protein GspK [Enhygromyxa salina]|nr:type II secretion system protein GspK [Enhygromyxa salina]